MNWFDLVDAVVGYVVGGFLVLGLLFLLRRVFLWYWKLDLIEKHLAEIAAAAREQSQSAGSPRNAR